MTLKPKWDMCFSEYLINLTSFMLKIMVKLHQPTIVRGNTGTVSPEGVGRNLKSNEITKRASEQSDQERRCETNTPTPKGGASKKVMQTLQGGGGVQGCRGPGVGKWLQGWVGGGAGGSGLGRGGRGGWGEAV